MESKYFGSISIKSKSNKYGGFTDENSLARVIKELHIRRSGVFVAPAGCGRTHFSKCVSDYFIESKIACIYIGLNLVRNANLLFRKEQLEETKSADQAIIILDGLEYLVQSNRSLYSILLSIEQEIKNTKLQFLVTCLPIDYSIIKPLDIIAEFQDSGEVFEAFANPLTIDELEDYIDFLPAPEYSSSPAPKLHELLSWIQYQGLEEYCCWPKDLYWLKFLKNTHKDDDYISLEYVHESWTRYEFEYAYSRYHSFNLGKANQLIQEVCLSSSFSGELIDQLIGKYSFCMIGHELLAVLRCGLFSISSQSSEFAVDVIGNYKDWQIANLFQRKTNEGMPEKLLFDIAHVSVGTEEKLRGYSKGAMVYLSGKSEYQSLKKKIINDHPEAMIDMADSNELSLIEKSEILQGLQGKLQGQDVGYGWIKSGLKRFFDAELEPLIRDQYYTYSLEENLDQNHAYIRLLTELTDCSEKDFILDCASSVLPRLTKNMSQLESATIQYLGQWGGNQYRQILVSYVDYSPDENHEAIEKYARSLYHIVHQTLQRGMDIPQFLDNLRKVIDIQTNEDIYLKSFIGYRVWDRLSTTQEKNQIISGLLEILTAENGSINARYRWLISPLGRLALQSFNENDNVEISSPAGQVLKSYLRWYNPSLSNSDNCSIPLGIAIDNLFELQEVKRAWLRHVFKDSDKSTLRFSALTSVFFRRGGLWVDQLNHDERLSIEITKDIEEEEDFRLFAAHNIQSIGVLEGLLDSELGSTAVKKAINEQIKARNISVQNINNFIAKPDKDCEEKKQRQKKAEEQNKHTFVEGLIKNKSPFCQYN